MACMEAHSPTHPLLSLHGFPAFKQAFCSAAGLSKEAAAEVKRLTADVWFSYLRRLTMPTACGDGGINIGEDFRCLVGSTRSPTPCATYSLPHHLVHKPSLDRDVLGVRLARSRQI